MSWGNTYVTKLNKTQACQNKCVKNMFFASKRENPISYMNLLSILKIDNIFRLKTAVFTYKLINKINNVPIIFINTISTASSQHSYSTRFAKNQNFRRSKAQANYGIFTFRFASSKIWETIPNYIKQSNSISVFKKRYTQFLLSSRSGLFQIRQSTSCPQANCVFTSNNYFNGFFRFKYFLNVFKDE